MLKVGLTGGIGAGKSVVAEYLNSLGAVVIDSDLLAREVVAPGTEGLAEIAATFGSDVLIDGGLDRAALASRIFGDAEARVRLEAIIHPRVRDRTAALIAASGDAIIIHDVPLLVEVGLAPTYHLVLVVEADREIRLERLVRRGLSRIEAESRMAVQASDEQRRAVADILLDNSGELSALQRQLDSVWKRLLQFADNIRQGRPVRRSERLAIVESDPAWSARYVRLAARIRYAAGDAVITLDHIGSTAVPGLPAKDVIDLQLGVADLDTADTLGPTLATAGFPPYPGVWYDNPGSRNVEAWPKRLHGTSDPGCIGQIHVRVVGSPGWRWALLFRDWLRANPTEAADYAAEKARLAARGLTTSDYADAKEPWFSAAIGRAEDWATATGWTPALG
jgi:dephospho-CoA kinase